MCWGWGCLLPAGQGQNTAYFQQKVHYDIEVQLDDELHQLAGTMRLSYTNQSPETLEQLYFHLWPNAYAQRNSELGLQLTRFGDTEFYFARPEDRGGLDTLSFSQEHTTLDGNTAIDSEFYAVQLLNPLLPGATAVVDVVFRVRIPKSFSRLGRVGQSYQITQWYPKPAVYDSEGWHLIPYLDIGEFYSEFGSFDVRITVPENYWVAATGTLQTSEERTRLEGRQQATMEWLDSNTLPDGTWKQIEKDTFPASATTMKTLRYTAEHVHDFAWFADKRFWVLKDTLELGERSVDCWAFFTQAEANLWHKAPFYLKRALRFYSEEVGAYPYPQATAVQSPFSKGGGMEYPMITLLGLEWTAASLDETITHEVGHNWFYGILASNEREYAWMDEGMNSFYEKKYMDRYYDFSELWVIPKLFRSKSPVREWEFSYLYKARRHSDQAAQTPANDFTYLNYWLGAYEKPAWAMTMLEEWMGTAAFKAMMQGYYQAWRFRHPGPDDFLQFAENWTGRDLSWWAEGWIEQTDRADYGVTRIRPGKDSLQLTLRNKGTVVMPFSLAWVRQDSIYARTWFDGFEGDTTLVLPNQKGARLTIDPDHVLPDFDRSNNTAPGRFRPKLKLFTGLEDDGRQMLYWTPTFAWNQYDKAMLGIGLHNFGLLDRPLKWALLPVYSLERQQLNGLGYLGYTVYLSGGSSKWLRFGLEGRRFSDSYNDAHDYYTQYIRLSPQAQWRLQKDILQPRLQTLGLRTIILRTQTADFDTSGVFTGLDWQQNIVTEFSYRLEDRRAINPYSLELKTEFQQYELPGAQQGGYLRLSADWRSAYTYKPDRNLYLRLFLGAFAWNTQRTAGAIYPGAFYLTGQGYPNVSDYRYDDLYLGRRANSGSFSQQIYQRDAGFKNAFGSAFRNQTGNTNDWMLALNFKADLPEDLPLNLPVKPYFELAYVPDRQPANAAKGFEEQLWWSAGFCIEYGDAWVGVYFPIVHSRNIRALYDQDGRSSYWSRITFTIDFNQFRPESVKEKLIFGI
ncbi:MAG: M1 family metallopeptidase [Phaeodactylibacter sp.]|nr:M1 family metallopeptidase [Phaeodactylibacter sp.]